ncbi:MAG: histidine kinase [Bacilli bacterium]|nr:histidine kinase [Bacilli bacterium]
MYRTLFNLGISIVAMIVFSVLFLTAAFSGDMKNKNEKLFSGLIFSVLICATFNTAVYWTRLGEVDIEWLNYLLTILRFIAIYISNIFFLLYCVNYFELSPKHKHAFFAGAIFLSVASTFFVSLNPIFHYFYEFDGYKLKNAPFLPLAYLSTIIVLMFCFAVVVIKKPKMLSEKVAFITFTFLPLIALALHLKFEEYSIFTIGIIASFLFQFLFYYIQRGKTIAKQQQELSEQQIRIMLSQIQPHFIYNCLSSISYLCTKDGKKAEAVIDDFSNYLRVNFSNINQTRIVSFSKELEHTQAYLRLEKLRFEDRVNVVFDIKASNFVLPALTLQPIVENAVKHGVCKKVEGGTVTISSWEDGNNYFVKVSDDGVGFDTKKPLNNDREHVGLKNVSNRLEHLSFGKMEVSSKLNVGTTVVISIPKQNQDDKKETNK